MAHNICSCIFRLLSVLKLQTLKFRAFIEAPNVIFAVCSSLLYIWTKKSYRTFDTVEDLHELHLTITLVQIYTWIFLSQTNIDKTNQSNTVFLYYLIQVSLFFTACWKISTRQNYIKRTTNKLSVHMCSAFPQIINICKHATKPTATCNVHENLKTKIFNLLNSVLSATNIKSKSNF